MAASQSGGIRVLVADDHAPFRRALIRLLSLTQGMEPVGEAGNGLDARDLCHALRPDVAVLDLSMPGMSGDEVTREIKEDLPATRVIILSVFSQEQHVRRGLEAGADRYLTKGITSDELLAAIRALYSESHRSTERG